MPIPNGSVGQVFTPEFIARFMVQNLLNRLSNKKDMEGLTVLEPAAGKGVFLTQLLNHGFSNITAYEMDPNLKYSLKKNFPSVRFRFENFFGSSLEEKFDLIIGNPPYIGQNDYASLFQEYVQKYPICKKYFIGNMDLFYYFIHLGIEKLRPGGLLSYITTNYWITKSQKTGIKYLKPHILRETDLIQYIDLSTLHLFPNARGQHNCIFVLRKKHQKEISQKTKSPIEIIQVRPPANPEGNIEEINSNIFRNLINGQDSKSEHILRYPSALSPRDLKEKGSWNLLYPEEIKTKVEHIENFCRAQDQVVFLKDLFIIRNGLIFPKDKIFILNEQAGLKKNQGHFLLKVNEKTHTLNTREEKRLKTIYKSRAIHPFGFDREGVEGYGIYFNKRETENVDPEKRNEYYRTKYPHLTAYLDQYEKSLKEILKNAKENPLDYYFPRRGAFIKNHLRGEKTLVDLEPFYERHPKIFFSYITSENIFGFTKDSYFATSDTYFLWPKLPAEEIDYPFFIAYLNSQLVYFLFKAKNITIKRSKTKLEYGIPIPNLTNFRSEKDMILLSLIRLLSKILMGIKKPIFNESFYRLKTLSYLKLDSILNEIKEALVQEDQLKMRKIIDILFFTLFELDPNTITQLLEKYH
ncbi:MAG: hypothetical protein EU544_01905 [Promethearchaeota archaeon]|nr:MAG: hypothetical protein EU544_01905 [Candidatus Lokiarchaeota archaeon]